MHGEWVLSTWAKQSMAVLLLVALAGYLLPWMVAPSAPMTLNGYDLAEWTSLHPQERGASVPLTVPLLLRIQLPILGMLLAMLARGRTEMALAGLFITLASIAQLPPLEFLYNMGDPNYRQQAFLAFLTLAGSAGAAGLLPSRMRALTGVGLAVIGIVAALVGQSQAQMLYASMGQDGVTGVGPWLMIAAHGGMALVSFSTIVRRR